MDYTAFDSFLNVDTWHTSHPRDDQRFYLALAEVVGEPWFDPEAMGEYMREKAGAGKQVFSPRIDRLVQNAWAVRDYLKATGDI